MSYLSRLEYLGKHQSSLPPAQHAKWLKTEMCRLLFGHEEKVKPNFLYQFGLPFSYMVSENKPAGNTLWNIHTRPYAPSYGVGTSLAFKVRLNPAYSNGSHHSFAGTHYCNHNSTEGMTGQDILFEAVAGWFREREGTIGFRLAVDPVMSLPRLNLYKPYTMSLPRKDAEPMTYVVVDTGGYLEVTDPAKFTESLLHGIGDKRRYDCGLLVIW